MTQRSADEQAVFLDPPNGHDGRQRWTVTLARDLTEYADVIIEAPTSAEAEALAQRMISGNTLPDLRWRQGDDREDIHVIDAQEEQ